MEWNRTQMALMKQDHPRISACILDDSDLAPFGITPGARLERQLSRAGIACVHNPHEADLILSGQHLFGSSILPALARAAPGTLLVDDHGRCAAARLGAGDVETAVAMVRQGAVPAQGQGVTGTGLAGRYDMKLRKRADPLVMRLSDTRAGERVLFGAAYKGVTDIVTKYLWPAPALVVTRWCARLAISPNQVTWMSAVLMALAFWLFWRSDFAAGLAVGWAMTFLDTVDGKLARVTLASSRFGDLLDHSIDLIHPPFWWWAWAVGCAAIGLPLNDGGLALGVIVAGYIVQRAQEGVFIARFGIEMHVWRRFDSLFRLVTARRNPNMLILTLSLVLGAPREGLIVVAIWTLACLMVHFVRLGQAFWQARRGPLIPWLAEG